MSVATVLAAMTLGSLTLYVLTGGADFGGGIWELFARGPRAGEQRRALRDAIAPIWEANHVWLILVVVLLFACFPVAFSAIMTALHIPIALMLIGIVLRGAAFVFRSYSAGAEGLARNAETTFAVASVATPFLLGVVTGAVASGAVQMDVATGVVETDFVSEWASPFPVAMGLFTLTLCAYMAAVYMTVELERSDLAEDFRSHGLVSGVAVGACAFLCAALAHIHAPALGVPLTTARWALPFHGATGMAAVGALLALGYRRYRVARALAVLQVTLIILGWGLAQYPYFIPPDLSIEAAAASPEVLEMTFGLLVAGFVLLAPALIYLYSVFKTPPRV